VGRQFPDELPRRGDFGFSPLVGNFDPVAADGAPSESYFGLTLEGSWPYGVYRADDGTLYALHRNCQGRTTRGVGLQRAAPGDPGLSVMRESLHAATGGYVSRDLVDGRDSYSSQQWPGGPSFEFAVGPDVRHREVLADGTVALDIAGDRIGPGFHVYSPWRGGGLYYTSLAYDAAGEFFGTPVSGFALLDQSYLAHGEYWNDSRVWNEIQIVWGVFCNRYADGDADFGHFSWGAGGFRFISVAGPLGTKALTREGVTVKVDFRADGFADEARIAAGDEEWVFTTFDNGAMVDASAARPGWRGHVGSCRRAGDDRVMTKSLGWVEIFPDRLASAQDAESR
jgi:hypothetical protein